MIRLLGDYFGLCYVISYQAVQSGLAALALRLTSSGPGLARRELALWWVRVRSAAQLVRL